MTVKGYLDRVVVAAGGRAVAEHARCYGRSQQVLYPLHYLATLERRPAALDHAPVYRDWEPTAALVGLRRELERLSREAAASGINYEQSLLRLAEAELAARASNSLEARIKHAAFPVAKDFDAFDFAVTPALSKPRILELALCE